MSQNVTIFGDKGLKEVFKMKFSRWVLIQYDRCPHKKGFGHRHAQKEDHVKHQKMTAICKSKREALEETDSADT